MEQRIRYNRIINEGRRNDHRNQNTQADLP